MRYRSWVLPLAVPILLPETALTEPECPLLSVDVPPDPSRRIFTTSWRTSPTPSPSCASASDLRATWRSPTRKNLSSEKGLAALDTVYTEIDFASIDLSMRTKRMRSSFSR